MKLIICEKPSVAKEFAKVLGVDTGKRQNGYFEDNDWIITWAVGHLVTLSYPEAYDENMKKWSLDTIPFIPSNFKYEVIKDVKDQFNIVKKLLQRKDVDVIYNAGDSGREGEYIQRLIFQEAKPNPSAKKMRIWIDSQTEEEIKNGIKNAKPESEYDKISDAAYERGIEDYLAGINFSRAFSIVYGRPLNAILRPEKYIPFSVGRVMTCTLGMVVEREQLVRNFKETFSYGVSADTCNGQITADWDTTDSSEYNESPKLAKSDAFIEKSDAEQLCSEFSKIGQLCVADINRTTERKNAPMLFNLTELQSECSKRLKISPDETLDIAQSLYEKKLTTYPRTDARVLSTAVAKEIFKNITGVASYTPVSEYAKYILDHNLHDNITKTKYVNDAQISDHYAIIPTGSTSGLGGLSSMELAVYDLIVRRMLSIFYPPAEYGKIQVSFSIGRENLFAGASKLNARGFLDVIEYEEKEDKLTDYNILNQLKVGDILPAEFFVAEKKSAKPKKYTSGSLVLTMEGAGKLIEDPELRAQLKGSGVGTPATRAETVKKLIKNGYITLNTKTQVISATELGEMIYTVVKMIEPTLLNPAFTANWEKGLSQIESGEITAQVYRDKLTKYVAMVTNKIKSNDISQLVNQALNEVHVLYGGEPVNFNTTVEKQEIAGIVCPCCGSKIVRTKWGYSCEKYKNGCLFSVGEICGVTISEKELIKVITGGESSKMKFKSKAGKDFESTLTLQDDEKKGKKIWLKPWD